MKNLLQNLLLSFISLILFIVVAELLARIFWRPSKHSPDVRQGLVMEGANRTVSYEGIEYQINSYGIRSEEFPPEKDSTIVRIMALGDSFIWGDGQKNDELLTVKLEKLLNSHCKKKFRVINTGIGGYNSKDEFNQLLRLAPVYKPDFVLQFFFTNDVLATIDGNLIRDWKVISNMWLRKNSKLYSLFYYLIKSTINAKVSFPKFLLPQDYYNLDDSKKGWIDFKKYTSKIIEFCKLNKIGYTFVFIPTLTNLDENYPYIEVKDSVAAYVSGADVPFLSYFDLFSKYKPSELWVSEENTHWNSKATSLAADTLLHFLLKNKLITLD